MTLDSQLIKLSLQIYRNHTQNRDSRKISILAIPFNTSLHSILLTLRQPSVVCLVVGVFCCSLQQKVYMFKCVWGCGWSIYKSSGGWKEQAKEEKGGRKPWHRWEVPTQLLPARLTLSLALHMLSTPVHPRLCLTHICIYATARFHLRNSPFRIQALLSPRDGRWHMHAKCHP